MAREQQDMATCSSCMDKRRGAEPWCLRCGTPFAESAPVAQATFRIHASRPGNDAEPVYIRDDLPEVFTDFVQYLAYFAQLYRSHDGDPEQQARLDRELTPLAVGLRQLPEAQREGAAVYILDNMYRGAASIQGRMDGALYSYVSALGKAVAPILSSSGAVYAYMLDNSFDNPDRFELILDLFRCFKLVVSCPEAIASDLIEHDTGTKVRPLGLSDWPRYADEAWHVATALVRKAASERRPLFVFSVHFSESAYRQIRELLLEAGYTVVFRNEAPVTGSQIQIARPAVT